MIKKLAVFALFHACFMWPDAAFAAIQSDSFLSPLGPVAAAQKSHLIWVIALTMIAALPVFILVPLLLIKYRRGNKNADYQPKWEDSRGLEIFMWGVPIALVVVMSVCLWQATHKLDPYTTVASRNPVMNVQVVGLDWKWLFIYPDLGIASVGELGIPVDRPVELTLTTDTVMQSFIIPALAGQIYAMPGMTTKQNILAATPAQMEGENTQYNGEGFTEQKFMTLAMAQPDFENWVTRVKNKGISLNEKSYKILAQRSTRAQAYKTLATNVMPENVLYFTLGDRNLFHSILHRYHGDQNLERHQQPGTEEYGAHQ